MNTVFSPLVSEFQIHEQADNYTHWFQAKLKRAEVSANTQPTVLRDQAMTEIRALLKVKPDAN